MLKNILSKIMPKPVDNSIISKASRFVACEMVGGDYVEFGTYQGSSFIQSYRWLKKNFTSRARLRVGGDNENDNADLRMRIWNEMRFFAFDSFKGLPKLTSLDSESVDFETGQYACSEEQFFENVTAAGVPNDRIVVVPGYFENSCTSLLADKHGLSKISIAYIDSDLYSSTKTVLAFIKPLVQDGTVLIFDDWFSYRGNPKKGVQRAFFEWVDSLNDQWVLVEYQKDSWKRNSFIVCEK